MPSATPTYCPTPSPSRLRPLSRCRCRSRHPLPPPTSPRSPPPRPCLSPPRLRPSPRPPLPAPRGPTAPGPPRTHGPARRSGLFCFEPKFRAGRLRRQARARDALPEAGGRGHVTRKRDDGGRGGSGHVTRDRAGRGLVPSLSRQRHGNDARRDAITAPEERSASKGATRPGAFPWQRAGRRRRVPACSGCPEPAVSPDPTASPPASPRPPQPHGHTVSHTPRLAEAGRKRLPPRWI